MTYKSRGNEDKKTTLECAHKQESAESQLLLIYFSDHHYFNSEFFCQNLWLDEQNSNETQANRLDRSLESGSVERVHIYTTLHLLGGISVNSTMSNNTRAEVCLYLVASFLMVQARKVKWTRPQLRIGSLVVRPPGRPGNFANHRTNFLKQIARQPLSIVS